MVQCPLKMLVALCLASESEAPATFMHPFAEYDPLSTYWTALGHIYESVVGENLRTRCGDSLVLSQGCSVNRIGVLFCPSPPPHMFVAVSCILGCGARGDLAEMPMFVV